MNNNSSGITGMTTENRHKIEQENNDGFDYDIYCINLRTTLTECAINK